MRLETLHAEAIDNYADPGPRGVYADALSLAGDPRGELITIGGELERAGVMTTDALVDSALDGDALARIAHLLRRAARLHAEYDAAWTRDVDSPGGEIGAHGIGNLYDFDLRIHAGDAAVIDEFGSILRRVPVLAATLLLPEATAAERIARLPLGNLRKLELKGGPLALEVIASVPSLSVLVLDAPSAEEIAGIVAPGVVDLTLRCPDRATIDALARSSIARQLRRLTFTSGVEETDLSQLLDGRFASLEHLSINIHGSVVPPRAGRLRVPRSLELQHRQVGTAWLEVLAAHSSLERLRITPPDPVGFAAILRAPGLDDFGITTEIGRWGAHLYDDTPLLLADAERRIARLDLGDSEWEPDVLDQVLITHAPERLVARCDPNQVVASTARTPGLQLRELVLGAGEVADETVDVLASAPVFSRLRRLGLAKTNLSDRAVRSLARSELNDLVELDIAHNVVRISPELCELPALVSIVGHELGSATARAQVRAHFGALTWPRRLELVVLVEIAPSNLEALLVGGGFGIRARLGVYSIGSGETAVKVEMVRPFDPAYARAAACLSPERAEAIVERIVPISIRRYSPELAGTEGLRVAQMLATTLDGVIWDLYDDCLVATGGEVS